MFNIVRRVFNLCTKFDLIKILIHFEHENYMREQLYLYITLRLICLEIR